MIDEPFDGGTDYAAQARELLVKSREYLAAGDLHQASEKGWEAVALARGWQHSQYSHFHRVMDRAGGLVDGDGDYLAFLHGRAEILHANIYELKQDLNARIISKDLEYMSELVDLLEAKGIGTRVVSMPCWELFEAKDESYRKRVLPKGPIRIGIEAASRLGWDRWLCGERGSERKAAFIGMDGFGASAPGNDLFEHFGITANAVAEKAESML